MEYFVDLEGITLSKKKKIEFNWICLFSGNFTIEESFDMKETLWDMCKLRFYQFFIRKSRGKNLGKYEWNNIRESLTVPIKLI